MSIAASPARMSFAAPERRVDGALKVTGSAGYTDDMSMPGMLWADFLYSPVPHARIASIDTAAALALPGVHAVLTGRDTEGARFGRNMLDWPVLADGVVRFAGDRVAAVAAESPDLARQAVELIDVEYEELPAVYDIDDALAPGAPVLHPDVDTYRVTQGTRPAAAHPNVQGNVVAAHGETDIEAALVSADLVVESRFRTPAHHHGALEPHAALVWLDDDGIVHVVSTNKAPFTLARQMSATLGVPVERIVVDNGFIGGDFGGKGTSVLEFPLYYLARATGRPVKAVLGYADEIATVNTRHKTVLRLRTGVNRDGTFVAHAAEVWFNGGAYAAGKPAAGLILPGGVSTLSAYAVPNARIELTTVYTNTVPGGHVRSPGEVQAVFAGESHVDMIAARLGMDPLELRRRNALRPGQVNAAGEGFAHPAAVEVLDAARSAMAWDAPRPPGRGVGIALYQRAAGGGKGGIILRALPSGLYELVTGVVDQGVGTHTELRRIAATALGIAEDRVVVTRMSTRDAMFDSGLGGSRTTRVLGEATRQAADHLLRALDDRVPGDEPVEVRHEYEATGHSEDTTSFIAEAVEVEVDRETGEISVVDAALAVDIGQVVNPIACRGQMEGGFAFGLGAALMEDLEIEQGQVVTATLGDYKLPSIADIPPVRIVEVHPADGPENPLPKAVGELTNSGVPPAIANAVAAASGARVTSLPITAEAVYSALRAELGGPE